MERDSYIEGIRGAWLGELFGEAFFNAMAQRSEDESMSCAWRTLAKLENVTGKKMAALLQTHNESATTSQSIEIGDEMLEQYTAVPHVDAMLRMQDVVDKAIIRFDQLLAVAPDEDVPAVQFLVHHEQALQTFVEREISGDHAHALADVEGLLKQANG